jgi:hypothetical protein
MPKYTYLRLPVGVAPPVGYDKVNEPVTTRSGTFQVYRKQVQIVNKKVFDELSELFGSMGMNEQNVQQAGIAVAVIDENEQLTNLFGNMSMNGGRRKSRRTRKNKRN